VNRAASMRETVVLRDTPTLSVSAVQQS